MYGLILAHLAILLIKVDEVPSPQFVGKSSLVVTTPPEPFLRKFGFNFLAERSKLCNAIVCLFSCFKIVRVSSSNSHLIHVLFLLSRLFQSNVFDPSKMKSKLCLNFVGIAKAFAPSRTKYSDVIKSFPGLEILKFILS